MPRRRVLPQLLLLLLPPFLASGFPVSELVVSNETFHKLSDASLPQADKDTLATSQVLPHLQFFFNSTAHAIEVTTDDVAVSGSYPSQTVDDSCDHKVIAKNPKGTAKILNDTHLMFGVSKISWKAMTVFADARLDSVLDIYSDIQVKLGKHIFGHHCTHIASKTVGVDVVSHGTVGLGLNFTASNAHVEKAVNGSGYELVFKFECDSVALVLKWNVEEVKANNCKLKILGIEILSYCGYLEKAIKNGANKLSTEAIKIDAPKVASKVENALNTFIGGTVRIPLKF
eukprot:CAMPEP_0114509206 /NCGR_PEP_ID=MMETSP0109-20121206/13073_1 /TAXON_ID=29199 /ORGANISM="Chlorarachnion reptans, Strain CCCM449" /LENGTH=285 /DNA_ID=CAMNT_0001688317 /DNA_START=48 /DNA_END=905 /DNA_ORIENTATION=+